MRLFTKDTAEETVWAVYTVLFGGLSLVSMAVSLTQSDFLGAGLDLLFGSFFVVFGTIQYRNVKMDKELNEAYRQARETYYKALEELEALLAQARESVARAEAVETKLNEEVKTKGKDDGRNKTRRAESGSKEPR